MTYNSCYLLIIGDTLKTASTGKARSGSVTIKLGDADRDRIAALASARKRTPHFLMKEAILAYVRREEARQNFISAAESSYEHYKETGLHITLGEMSAWVDEAQQDPDAPLPECHT